MDWSNEVTLEFLKLYEHESVIWNPEHVLHRCRKPVNDAWLRIQQSMSIKCSVNDLKKKKESLMATFRQLRNKYKACRRTGNGTADLYKPSWFAFEAMARFLHGIYESRSAANAKGSITDEFSSYTVQIEEESDHESDEAQITIVAKGDEEVVTEIPSENLTSRNAFTHFPDRAIRKRKRSHTGVLERRMIDAHNISVRDTPRKDECSLYADLLAAKLRAFDGQTRDILMHDIDNLVFKAKMQQRTQQFQPLLSISPRCSASSSQSSPNCDNYSE